MPEQATQPVDVQPNQHVGNTDVARQQSNSIPPQSGTASQTTVPDHPPVKSEPDLLSRVSQFRKSSASQSKGEDFFDFSEIERISDPVAKDIAVKAYKTMQAGMTKKTQDLAEQRRQLEAREQSMNTWTPQRVQSELLNNPTFLQSAQSVVGTPLQNPQSSGLTNNEFSALTDKEQQEFISLRNKINLLEQANVS